MTPIPPETPVREVRDNYFNTTVVDPYRWMESPNSAEFDDWLRKQNAFARQKLDSIPGRPELAARIEALSAESEGVWDLMRVGKALFFLRQVPGAPAKQLYVAEGGSETILVDPRADSANARSIDYYAPSSDGRFVAVGQSVGGDQDSTLSILDRATGRVLDERIEHAEDARVAWLSGNRGFAYTRRSARGPGEPESVMYERMRVYRHVLGTPATSDQPIFGYGVAPSAPSGKDDWPGIFTDASSKFAIGILNHGVRRELSLFATPKEGLSGGVGTWVSIANAEDAVTQFAVRGDYIYLLTHRDAPHSRIVRYNLAAKDVRASGVTVVPESAAYIKQFGRAADALYFVAFDGLISSLSRVSDDGQLHSINLPFAGSIRTLSTNPTEPGALFDGMSWTVPKKWYVFAPDAGTTKDTGLIRDRGPANDDLEAKEVFAQSADGTAVPLSVVYRRGIALDGLRPTILDVYGAYGYPFEPGFNAIRRAWLERGGVYAVAHVRGGGEFGEPWHLAGMKATKAHSVEDFIACANYLIANRYTSASHLGATSLSAGGITVNGAIVARPDLFRAFALDSADANPLRSEFAKSGAMNTAEYGSVTTEEGFRALLAMDAYQHVRNDVQYPAALFLVGMNDSVVPTWQSGKMVARLQAASKTRPALLRVALDEGHGGGATRIQVANAWVDKYAFLFSQLVGAVPPGPADPAKPETRPSAELTNYHCPSAVQTFPKHCPPCP